MRRWFQRLPYLLLLLAWVVILFLPLAAAVLAYRGEIEVGGNGGRHHIRVFLLQQRQTEGIGVTWTRPLAGQPNCRRTTLRYFLWRGTGENATFCQCLTNDNGETVSGVCP
jgi:hypothetical protein